MTSEGAAGQHPQLKVLFVCSRNRLRSPTAEAVFSQREGLDVLSAGTAVDAETPLSAELLDWADVIFAMEGVHRRRMEQRFPEALRAKKIIVLGIRDEYRLMDPKLIARLEEKVSRHILRS